MDIIRTENGWNLSITSGREKWVQHNEAGQRGRFVARFKYMNAGESAKHFCKFLTENFTPAEYFALSEAEGGSPMKALETKGYVGYNTIQAVRRYFNLGRKRISFADAKKLSKQMISAEIEKVHARLPKTTPFYVPSDEVDFHNGSC